MSVALRGLNKKFGDLQVLKDIELEVSKGELFSVVGPSGSGKTTLLRVVAGLETQDGGHVYIDGKLSDTLTPAKRNVGMVFQNYALYPNKTVAENIASPLLAKGVARSKALDEAAEMAKRLGIEMALDRKPGEISGGQQQRVALARALVKKPTAFLLDEPLSNLDAQLRFSARKFVKELQRDFGITTIYVTHDQAEALSISDRIAILDMGVILQVGTPMEIYREPANEFVANFIGYPPLNTVRMGLVGKSIQFTHSPPPGAEHAGIRPEAIVLGGGPNRAKVISTEFSGRESVVYLDMQGQELRALFRNGKVPSEGETIDFSIAEEGVMWFDAKGMRLVG
jgi:ABC-type sugar transport system ATPase subunit